MKIIIAILMFLVFNKCNDDNFPLNSKTGNKKFEYLNHLIPEIEDFYVDTTNNQSYLFVKYVLKNEYSEIIKNKDLIVDLNIYRTKEKKIILASASKSLVIGELQKNQSISDIFRVYKLTWSLDSAIFIQITGVSEWSN